MKKLVILLIFAVLICFFACNDEPGPMLGETITAPAITSPSAGAILVMNKPMANSTTVFTWSAADFGIPVGVLYTLQASKAGDNFTTPVDIVSVNALGDTMTYADFNAKMIALEATMESPNPVEIRVQAFVPQSDADTVYSQPVLLTITPYTAKDHIYLVGQHNGWNNATAPVMNRSLSGLKYELYLNLPEAGQGFKILPTLGSWDGDIGEDPANPGHLIATGERDLKVPAPGFYRISADLQALTWSALRISWGLIGDFNNWAADQPMTYNTATGVFTGTINAPAAGKFKFRANGNWDLNFGDTGADGTLEEGGTDLSLPSGGTYTVTLNLKPEGNPQAYKYTVVRN